MIVIVFSDSNQPEFIFSERLLKSAKQMVIIRLFKLKYCEKSNFVAITKTKD